MSDPLVTAIESALSDTVAWRKPAYLSDTVQSLIAAGEYRKAAEAMAPRIRSLVDVSLRSEPTLDEGLRESITEVRDSLATRRIGSGRSDVNTRYVIRLIDNALAARGTNDE
jgi:hypothetical protein